MSRRVILDSRQFSLILDRLCHQLIENHKDFSHTVLVGIQPRGILLSERITGRLGQILGGRTIPYGKLDVTFYRDDFRRKKEPMIPDAMDMEFSVEDKNVVLIDDVLYSGRTVRAAMDALLDFGRPHKVELLVLIDRRFSRHLPVQPDYVGKTVDAVTSEYIKVEWKETDKRDKVWILPGKEKSA